MGIEAFGLAGLLTYLLLYAAQICNARHLAMAHTRGDCHHHYYMRQS